MPSGVEILLARSGVEKDALLSLALLGLLKGLPAEISWSFFSSDLDSRFIGENFGSKLLFRVSSLISNPGRYRFFDKRGGTNGIDG